MEKYDKLVEALRCDWMPDDSCKRKCPYADSHGYCDMDKVRSSAADAIEALLPRRGEWITIRLNNGGSYTGCSCCEAPIPTDTMLDYIPESESKYCYSCGAKMEAQDG